MKILGFHFLTLSQIKFLNKYTKRIWDEDKYKYVRGKWTLDMKTGLVNVNGHFNCLDMGLTDFKGVRFGVIKGSFHCQHNKLTSLEGAPKEVGGYFDCSYNKLTSLEGAPKKVGRGFDCHFNKLTSLVGAPQEVGGSFFCGNNQLTSLEGAPQEVGKSFDCSGNNLTSLEGAPKKVGSVFDCSNNQLTSLKGSPQKVGVNFNCYGNKLTSLKGAPKRLKGYLNCHANNLTSLEGAPPKKVSDKISCYNNTISEKTLKLVWDNMRTRKIDYCIALCILNGQIDSDEWDKMIRGYEDKITPEAIKTYAIAYRYSLQGLFYSL